MTISILKQQRAERTARSQFKPGAFVAVVNHHWDRRIERKAAVVKVHANGNFTICNRDGTANPQQWIPDWQGTTARKTGKPTGFRHPEHLEIWTPDHATEIVEASARRDRASRSEIVRRKIEEARTHDEHTLRALEAALGLSTAAPNVPEAD